VIQELKKCKEDIVYFAENYFYIVNLDRGKEVIKLYTRQRQILKSLVNNRFTCLLSCRQFGKTTLMTIYALWVSCFEPDQRIVIVANREQTAINIFKRIRTAYEQLPNFLKPGVKDYGKSGLTFDNDSSIGVSTTTSTAVRGESINCLIIDEMAFIENHLIEDFWKSVIPVISSGKKSKIFAVSTPNGTDNKFYEVYSTAERGKGTWKAERVDWWDIPGRTERWKQQMIDTLGSEDAFLQEFGNVFLDAGNSAIGAITFGGIAGIFFSASLPIFARIMPCSLTDVKLTLSGNSFTTDCSSEITLLSNFPVRPDNCEVSIPNLAAIALELVSNPSTLTPNNCAFLKA
jgi:hypothetical protein